MTRVLALVPTIPARRRSCTRMLGELAQQSRPPDQVLLCLDGYGEEPAPPCPLPVVEHRTAVLSGPGAKWRVAAALPDDDVLVGIDDDTMLCEAPHLVRALVGAMQEHGGAAAAMGRRPDGRQAPPGAVSSGRLIYGCGSGLAVRVEHLRGLPALAEQVVRAGGPHALGRHGDDDALVSAHLWQRGIPLWHAATGNLYAAPNTQASSQTRAQAQRGEEPEAQKKAIARITGWPWPGFR